MWSIDMVCATKISLKLFTHSIPEQLLMRNGREVRHFLREWSDCGQGRLAKFINGKNKWHLGNNHKTYSC